MTAKSLLCAVILCFFTTCNSIHAQVEIEDFEFGKHERLLLITGTSTSDKAIIDLFVTLDSGETSYLGGFEVNPADDAFGFSLGLTDQAKWPQGSYQIAIADFYDPMDVAYKNVIKGVGYPVFEDQTALLIFPFINIHWIPTLEEPNFPEEWVKPCPSHVDCLVIDMGGPEPFSPPLPIEDDDDDNNSGS